MSRRLVVLCTTLALMAVPSVPSDALPRGTKVETYKGSLSFPIDMAWVPGTRKIFFTEKNTGRVRVMVGRRLLARPCIDLAVDNKGERGALGITLHPNYEKNHFLFVYYTNESPRENRVTRFKVDRNRCTKQRHILTGLQSDATNHNAGHLEFVGGYLFVSVGENAEPAEAQDRSSRLGKILRVRGNGTVPDGNPFGRRNPVWAYGLRNPFGLGHNPETGQLYASENGPNCDDEINLIKKGRNYGWGPNYECGTRGVGPDPKGPLMRYSDIIVPADLWWYEGKMKSLSGSLYFGAYGEAGVHRLILNRSGNEVVEDRVIYDDVSVLDVSEGPGGWLYFMSNDAIYRIVPN